MLCQENLDWRQGKVREMSVNFVLSSLYEPWNHLLADDAHEISYLFFPKIVMS